MGLLEGAASTSGVSRTRRVLGVGFGNLGGIWSSKV